MTRPVVLFSAGLDSAVLLAEAAELAGVRRYLLVSAMGVDAEPDAGRGDVWVAYLQAKRAAEEALRLTDLDWTILRPGGLTDDPGTGRVQLSRPPVDPGSITRDDTAAVLLALLDSPGTAGLTLELVEGDDDVLAAVAAVAVPPAPEADLEPDLDVAGPGDDAAAGPTEDGARA